MKSKGIVYLVGAGPGDAGLLTLRGAELLARADVVIYDVLVNPELLRLAPSSAERIGRGGSHDAEPLAQTDIEQLLVDRAQRGLCVVRLKGGDPYIFGRGGEEVEALVAAKIPFEVVPGVSSIVAGPGYAGIPLTDRRHCSSFTVFTGHGDPEGVDNRKDLDQIAQIPGTKIVLMGMKRLRPLAESLMRRGMSPKTPVAVVQWATTGRQRSVNGGLGNIADLVDQQAIAHPAITVIGEVVKLGRKYNWFEKRPLFGQRIVVTRALDQANALAQRLSELGADVLKIPCIQIEPPDNKQGLVDVMQTLGEYDWIVFTSANGVARFFNYFFKAFEDVRDLGALRIAAVGPGTVARLHELHLKVDVVPKEALGRQVADALLKFESIENLKILLMRAEKANPELPQILSEKGAIVDDIPCYKTAPCKEDPEGVAGRLMAEGAHWITFTSGSTVDAFHDRFDLPKLVKQFPQMKLAAIGPETSKAIQALDLKTALEAKEHTVDGLIKALLAHPRRF